MSTLPFGTATIAAAKGTNSDPGYLPKVSQWYEKIWYWNQYQMQAPMPYRNDRLRYKINVSLTHTGLPWLTGDDWATSAESMNLMPTAMFYGSVVVPHEFTHVLQFYSGGYRNSDSVGAFWETHAEFGALMFCPFYDSDMKLMMESLRMGFQYPESRYANFPILIQLWEQKRTAPLVYGIWTGNRRKTDAEGSTLEDPAETMVRLGGRNGCCRWDGPLSAMKSEKWPPGWWRWTTSTSDISWTPQSHFAISQRCSRPTMIGLRLADNDAIYAYGVTHLRLQPDRDATKLRVTLKGLTDANQASWRLTLVAVNGADESRYSAMKRIVAGKEGSVEMDVRPGERYTAAVAATPLHYVPLLWKEPVTAPVPSYPIAIRFEGARPQGQ